FHSAINRFDFKTGATNHYDFGPQIHVGEPIYAQDPAHPADETRGWILVMGLDGSTSKSFMTILDVTDLSAGPVATLQLTHHTPLSFHGHWRQV
ncbi:MAG: carotenoid oxygenase family protein, partial [Sneathiella sp.]|nr:carotenoid oxygenase family protein [Sneathiella sp.]